MVKVHLHGRLGVITVPKSCVLKGKADAPGMEEPAVGTEMQFYFSYLQINETPYDYDVSAVKNGNHGRPGFGRRPQAVGVYRCGTQRGAERRILFQPDENMREKRYSCGIHIKMQGG